MISLAAWITVSMSALSKLRTTKRPRCAGGTGGAVGGGGGGGLGAGSGAGGATGGTVRGPTETGGSDGRVSPVGGASADGVGISGGLGRWRWDAHPLAATVNMRIVTSRLILLDYGVGAGIGCPDGSVGSGGKRRPRLGAGRPNGIGCPGVGAIAPGGGMGWPGTCGTGGPGGVKARG